MRSMANAIANKLFQPKATCLKPENTFFSIDPQWQKPLTRQKNPYPNHPLSQFVLENLIIQGNQGELSHKLAQFCTIYTNFAQFRTIASRLL